MTDEEDLERILARARVSKCSKVVKQFESEKAEEKEEERLVRARSMFKGQLDLDRFIVLKRLDDPSLHNKQSFQETA